MLWLCLLTGELNSSTFKVITVSGRTSFCLFLSGVKYVLKLFCPSFPTLLLSFVFSWLFCTGIYWLPSHLFYCIFYKCFFLFTMGITYNILKFKKPINLYQLNFSQKLYSFTVMFFTLPMFFMLPILSQILMSHLYIYLMYALTYIQKFCVFVFISCRNLKVKL